jgi:hypothetical protein
MNNKGTVSSALGKALAKDVLNGQDEILAEAVILTGYKTRNVRAGAAKIIEQVAMNAPEKVVPYLRNLVPALSQPEPQTRWMIIHTFGYCAVLAPDQAADVFTYAKEYLAADSGACLWGATIKFLGLFGATSFENAVKAFSLLDQALVDLPKQSSQILDAITRLLPVANEDLKLKISQSAISQSDSSSASTARAAKKILRSI